MSGENQEIFVYQLRVWIREISPAIWRRLLVRSDTTVADLHYILQIAFSWTDFHLHEFRVRAKSYGIGRMGCMSFEDDPRQVTLADFRFRTHERFVYQYDFGDR